MEKIKVAICYDFDKTLSKLDMQSYGYAKKLELDIDDLWDECGKFTQKHTSNNILTYLYVTLKKCREKGIKPTKEFFNSCGEEIEYFDGVETWFNRINKFAKMKNVEIEHYIISSGIKEIIDGTTIAKFFKEIFACSYCYDENKEAFWPALSIDYTNKTQFLYRVNKGIFSATDSSINDYMPHDDRYVQFENMIYIGDSETDIPSMKLIRSKNGIAIGVYNDDKMPDYYKDLIKFNRVDYIAKADYSKDSELSNIIEEIIETLVHKDKLKTINKKQKLS